MLVGAGALVVAGAGGAAISFARMGSLDDYARSLSATRVALARHPTLRDVIRYATLAASGHNTQPWRFSGDGGTVTIRPDLTRRTPVVDPDDHHLYASLGCAAENLKIAAAGSIGMAEPRFDAAGAILLASENAVKTALEAIQALGGAGYTKEWPVERFARDAKLYDIGAGTNEIRRFLIGRELIG
mgnify:CR=1 FL=1